MNLWLIPASDNPAAANVPKSLANPINDERKAIGRLPPEHGFAWGARSGPKNDPNVLERMERGDLMLFYTQNSTGGGKGWNFAAHFQGSVKNSDFGSAIWGDPRFELVYFLDEPKHISVPHSALYKSFLQYLDKFKGAPKGLIRINPTITDGLKQKFGTLDSWIDELNRGKPTSNPADDLNQVLARYARENIIFHSTEQRKAYSITEYEQDKFQLDRLDANEPVQISESRFLDKLESLRNHNGRLPFSDFDTTVALKNTYLQARCLALSADKKTVLEVSDNAKRLDLFCRILENLRVGKTPDGPKLYKPVMLACVIDAIESGALPENEITFEFIAPRFVEKMKALGVEATEENAAQPFYHLTGDQIWFHAVHDVNNPMQDGREGPAAARTKVKYALLKDTFWDLLQDRNALKVTRATLEQKWFTPDPTVKFWWVNQGQSYRPEREGGFIHAPKQDRGGNIPFHWKNMEKVQPDDLIFNYANGSIKAISISVSEPFETDTGGNFGEREEGGWQINLDYHDLSTPLPLATVGRSLAELQETHSPINRNGSVNQGYLFELSQQAVAIIAQQLDLDLLPEAIRKAIPTLPPSPPPTITMTSEFLQDASVKIRSTGLIYPDDLLHRFIFSLLAKPFVLLSGTSGTGKTQLALKFAQWLVGKDGYELVPVGADWTDNRQVLGHYNPFEKQFVSTRILDLMIRATKSPQLPFFLILDEMNLSHVERYFADFLSSMESGDAISLHRNGADVLTANGDPVEEEMTIPKNLFVIGTVNIDETTYMFSPKVLDRANVIEFALTATDLGNFMKTSGSGLTTPDPAPMAQSKAFLSFFKIGRSQKTLEVALGEDVEKVKEAITDIFSILEGSSMEFGFRTPTEFLKYCEIARDLSNQEAWDCDDACDIQTLQKVLPKLHGSRRRIEGLLVGLASYCADGNLAQATKYASGDSSPSLFKLDQSTPLFRESFKKLSKMIKVVQRDQFVSFIQ